MKFDLDAQRRVILEHIARADAAAARAREREDKFIPKPRVRDDEAARARENPDVVNVEDDDDAEVGVEYEQYQPRYGAIEGGEHPDAVVETGTLAKVSPPEPTYAHALGDLVRNGALSALQLESVTYACMRHEQRLKDGSRAGFFLGDGAGVGKGRQIAGLVYEHRRKGGRRVLWVSTSADLKFDAERDLNDMNAAPAIAVIPEGTAGLPQGSLERVLDVGVVFCTYSLLTQRLPKTPKNASTEANLRAMLVPGSRLLQLADWLKGDKHGPLIVFDECHKAKNLMNATGTPTKTALAVVALQLVIPNARVLYCSATGASEPKNLAYMTRLGHFGFSSMVDMLSKLEKSGLGALEIFACGLKATGSYLCRTLSYADAEFELVNCEIGPEIKLMYDRSVAFWTMMKKVFYAVELARGYPDAQAWKAVHGKDMAALIRLFWATHQRFFRQMLLCAKVPTLARAALKAVTEENFAVVIGLQSTGEASLARMHANDDEGEDEDFASSPAEMLTNFLIKNFPTTSSQASAESQQLWDSILTDVTEVAIRWCSAETIGEVMARRPAGRRQVVDDDELNQGPRPGARPNAENVGAAGAVAGAAAGAGAADANDNDDEIELVVEKSLDEVLAERMEAAKLAGDFFDLTEDDMHQRARAGASEAQVRAMEQKHALLEAEEKVRREKMLNEERELAARLQQQVNGVAPVIAAPQAVNRPSAEDAANVDARHESPAAAPRNPGSASKRSSPAGGVDEGGGGNQPKMSRSESDGPAPPARGAKSVIDPDIIELDLSDSDDSDERDFMDSVQKRRADFDQQRSLLGVAGSSSGAAARHQQPGVPPVKPMAPRPPAPAPRQGPQVNALERLQRFVRERDLRPAGAPVMREVKPQVKREGGVRRAAAAAAAANAAANDDEDDDLDDDDDEDDEMMGNPNARHEIGVENQHLLHIRALLIRAVESLQLPPNPLDNLIGLCGGHANVAEMTGRKLHQVRDADGRVTTRKRSTDEAVAGKMLNLSERKKFQDGDKLIAIISDAASTGISLQADRRVPNQRRRCHMTLELPWSADKAIQQFGRSHRANQSSAPLYRILMTPCGGERRFASSAAKRLLSLGALLKGDRRALGAGENLKEFDIDNMYGYGALRRMISDIRGDTDPLDCVKFHNGTFEQVKELIWRELINVGLAEIDDRGRRIIPERYKPAPKVSLFLNRLLGMPIDSQKVIFDYFTQTFEGYIKELKTLGKFDRGVGSIRGSSVVAEERHKVVIHKDELTAAETTCRLVTCDVGLTYTQVREMMKLYDATRAEKFQGTRQRGIHGFFIAKNKIAALRCNRPLVLYASEIRRLHIASQRDLNNPQMNIVRPNSMHAHNMDLENIESNYERISMTNLADVMRFRELWSFWHDYYSKICSHGPSCYQNRTNPGSCSHGKRHKSDVLVCGAVLPVWNEINAKFHVVEVNQRGENRVRHVQVVRAETTAGEKLVGLRLAAILEAEYAGFAESLRIEIEQSIKGGIQYEEEQPAHPPRWYDDVDMDEW